jgi:hypothetical protein
MKVLPTILLICCFYTSIFAQPKFRKSTKSQAFGTYGLLIEQTSSTNNKSQTINYIRSLVDTLHYYDSFIAAIDSLWYKSPVVLSHSRLTKFEGSKMNESFFGTGMKIQVNYKKDSSTNGSEITFAWGFESELDSLPPITVVQVQSEYSNSSTTYRTLRNNKEFLDVRTKYFDTLGQIKYDAYKTLEGENKTLIYHRNQSYQIDSISLHITHKLEYIKPRGLQKDAFGTTYLLEKREYNHQDTVSIIQYQVPEGGIALRRTRIYIDDVLYKQIDVSAQTIKNFTYTTINDDIKISKILTTSIDGSIIEEMSYAYNSHGDLTKTIINNDQLTNLQISFQYVYDSMGRWIKQEKCISGLGCYEASAEYENE